MTAPMRTDEEFMRYVLQLAEKGRGRVSPNPMVGAVVVKRGRIIAEGWHKRCGTAHAESLALNLAGAKANGATLYVSLEPCYHHGRTPPCVEHIIASGIRRVVIGQKDPNPLTNGKSIKKLRRSGVQVDVGVLRNACWQLNEVFNTFITTGCPFTVVKTAQTLDGKIATARGESKWITAEATRRFARRQRDAFDAILVGINTVIQDDPRLTGHRTSKRLTKIILDSQLRLPARAKLLEGTISGQCLVAVTEQAPDSKIKFWTKRGVDIIMCPTHQGKVNLTWLMKALAKRDITSVLIEGGSAVVGAALKAKIVHKSHVYVAPMIMGDERALDSVTGIALNQLNAAVRLEAVTTQNIGKDIFISGYVYRNN